MAGLCWRRQSRTRRAERRLTIQGAFHTAAAAYLHYHPADYSTVQAVKPQLPLLSKYCNQPGLSTFDPHDWRTCAICTA